MTRYVIHNHVPAKRAADAGPPTAYIPLGRMNGLLLYQKRSSGQYSVWANPHRKLADFSNEQMAREFAESYKHPNHGHDADPAYERWVEEQRKKQNEGGGAFYADDKNPRDFRGVVNHDEEERNRNESYDRTGIRRIARDKRRRPVV